MFFPLHIIVVECKEVGKDCKCSIQGDDACKAITGSQCDKETDACVCLPYMYADSNNKQCIAENPPVLISDGSSVAPFISNDEKPREFQPTMAKESAKTLGVNHNGYVLHVNGTVCIYTN